MKRVGKLLVAAAAAACIAPAGAAALETRDLAIGDPAARECAERTLPAGTRGVEREEWTAPAEGYVTLRLGGDPYAPDWDLAAFPASGESAASTNSGSLERVNLWVEEGERIEIQACRLAGGDAGVPLTIDLYAMPIPEPSDERFSMEEVSIDGPGDVATLEALGIDVTHDVSSEAATVATYSDAERDLLDAYGFERETLIHDLAARDARHLTREAAPRRDARSALPSTRDEYRVYEDYTSEMKALAAAFPDRVRSIVIGTSLEGRPIEGVEIATDVNRADDGRPVYLNIGLTHAREWPSGEFPMEFAIDLARNYDSSQTIRTILDRTRVVIAPVVNPDGFVASRSHGTSPLDDDPVATAGLSATGTGAYRRKNCRGVSPADQQIPCASRVSGVDLNRNYGAYWGGPGSGTDPTSQAWRGPAPFSEPESRAIRDYTSQVHPTVFVTNHTFTDGRWLRQPGFDPDFMEQAQIPTYDPGCGKGTMGAITPDEPAMDALGDAMAAANEPDWISELGYETLCDITGATEDWNYFNQGTYGYTPEAKGPNFHATFANMVAAEYVGNDNDATDEDGMRGAFLVAGIEAGETDNHGVIQGAAPAGAKLRLRKEFQTPTCEDATCANGNGPANADVLESSLQVPASGRYAWHVNPSTRPQVYAEDSRNTGPEAWTMTCKQDGQERSVAQQVLVGRGERVTVDWSGLCGTEGGGSGGGGNGQPPTCHDVPITVIGTNGPDMIVGTDDPDVIAAGDGDDRVRPGKGKDIVCGEAGDDRVNGAQGGDTLLGQKGDDALSGKGGRDTLRGASGADRLAGGKGRNTCVGGSGRDRFSSCD